MAHAQLTAVPRSETGNGPARRLRRQGMVPGVLYQTSGPAIAFAVPERELRRALISEGGRSGVVDLRIGDGPVQTTRLAEWQRDAVRGDILHIDLRPVGQAEVAQVAAEQKAEAERVAQEAEEAEVAEGARGADAFDEPDATDAE